ncbi:MAG: hypothetical protein ACKO01_09235 [Erythrobacter sp.]
MRQLPMVLLAGLALHLAAPLSAAPEAPAPSPQMSVAAFLERVGTLAKTGPEWTLSPEASKLFAAISETGKAYRQTLAQRRAAGQPVEACLPDTAEIDSDALFAHLAGYSAEAARQTSIADAFAALVRAKFPCG